METSAPVNPRLILPDDLAACVEHMTLELRHRTSRFPTLDPETRDARFGREVSFCSRMLSIYKTFADVQRRDPKAEPIDPARFLPNVVLQGLRDTEASLTELIAFWSRHDHHPSDRDFDDALRAISRVVAIRRSCWDLHRAGPRPKDFPGWEPTPLPPVPRPGAPSSPSSDDDDLDDPPPTLRPGEGFAEMFDAVAKDDEPDEPLPGVTMFDDTLVYPAGVPLPPSPAEIIQSLKDSLSGKDSRSNPETTALRPDQPALCVSDGACPPVAAGGGGCEKDLDSNPSPDSPKAPGQANLKHGSTDSNLIQSAVSKSEKSVAGPKSACPGEESKRSRLAKHSLRRFLSSLRPSSLFALHNSIRPLRSLRAVPLRLLKSLRWGGTALLYVRPHYRNPLIRRLGAVVGLLALHFDPRLPEQFTRRRHAHPPPRPVAQAFQISRRSLDEGGPAISHPPPRPDEPITTSRPRRDFP